MAEFVSLRVRVDLTNGQIVEGRIEAVAQDANLLLLSDAVVRSTPGDPRGSKFPRLELSGDQIKSIEIIGEGETETPSLARVRSPPLPPLPVQPRLPSLPPAGGRDGGSSSKKLSAPTLPSIANVAAFVNPPKILTRKDRRSPQKGGVHSSGRPSDWSQDDVKSYRSKEFDFQANLDLFDKQKVFSELKASDDVRPEDRLVSHNLMTDTQRSLRPDENVLETRRGDRREDWDGDEVMLAAGAKSSRGGAPPTRSAPTLETALLAPAAHLPAASPAHPATTLPSFALSAAKVESIEQQLIYSGAIGVEQMIESAGRSLAECLFQHARECLLRAAVSGPDGASAASSMASLPSSSSSSLSPILLYISVDRRGAAALSTGRVFLNRGLRVVAFISGDLQRAPVYFNQANRAFQAHGGILVASMPSAPALLISTVATAPAAKGVSAKIPTCAVVGGIPSATWQVRFGLPYDLPAAPSASRTTTVVCDAGWPATLVNQLLPKGCILRYERLFGLGSFTILSE